jgi:hypothetical protein
LPQLQTWAELQVVPAGQVVGQPSVPPQLSPMSPQYCCTPLALLHVTFTQSGPPTHTFLLPQTQLGPEAEQSAPQESELPQLSPTVPQYWPPEAGLQVSGVHTPGGPLHKPPSQSHPVFVHVVPQSTFDPHPSPTTPQYWSLFAVTQASGTQPDPGAALHRPSSLQAQLAFVHVVPQWTVPPHASPISPQY